MSENASDQRNVEIRVISAAQVMPLRCAVLRPNRPVAVAQFPDDDAPTTRHFGAIRDGQVLGIASLFRAEMAERPGLTAIQLRGMATAPEVRGAGFGRALVLACVDFAKASGVEILWCNARTGAVDFYRKLGFETVGQEFHMPDVGPHFRMLVKL